MLQWNYKKTQTNFSWILRDIEERRRRQKLKYNRDLYGAESSCIRFESREMTYCRVISEWMKSLLMKFVGRSLGRHSQLHITSHVHFQIFYYLIPFWCPGYSLIASNVTAKVIRQLRLHHWLCNLTLLFRFFYTYKIKKYYIQKYFILFYFLKYSIFSIYKKIIYG